MLIRISPKNRKKQLKLGLARQQGRQGAQATARAQLGQLRRAGGAAGQRAARFPPVQAQRGGRPCQLLPMHLRHRRTTMTSKDERECAR